MAKQELLPVPEGYKVKMVHVHKPEDLEECRLVNFKKPPRYYTFAWAVDSVGHAVAFASAACSPKDKPSRKLGRLIAHNRVVNYLRETICIGNVG
jgi:hypothetical protein